MEESKKDKILAQYKRAKDHKRDRMETWQELIKFDKGEQWKDLGLPPFVPTPVTNYIHYVKSMKTAAFAIENPVGKLRAIGSQNIKAVDTLNKVVEGEMERMKARQVVRDAISTAKLLGTAIVEVVWNEYTEVKGMGDVLWEGEVQLKNVPPQNFYIDPTATRLEDAQFIQIRELKPKDFIKNIHKTQNIEGTEHNDQEDLGRAFQDALDHESKEDTVVYVRHYEKIPTGEGNYRYQLTYLVNDKVVATTKALEPAMYPFADLHDLRNINEFWSKSTCELILDNQKIVNKVESIIALLGLQTQNPQKVVSIQSGLKPSDVAKYSNAPGYTWRVNGDPSRAIQFVNPPPIPQTLFQLAQEAKQNIRDITGINEAYSGQSVGSLQTTGGVNSLIDRATMRDRDQMFEIEMFVGQLTSIVTSFIISKYTEPRLARFLSPSEPEENALFVEYVGKDFEDVMYDIVVDVSTKAPITRQRTDELIDDLFVKQYQYPMDIKFMKPQEYVKHKDLPNMDDIVRRMDEEEALNKANVAMQAAQMASQMLMQGAPPEEVQAQLQQIIPQLEQQVLQGGQ